MHTDGVTDTSGWSTPCINWYWNYSFPKFMRRNWSGEYMNPVKTERKTWDRNYFTLINWQNNTKLVLQFQTTQCVLPGIQVHSPSHRFKLNPLIPCCYQKKEKKNGGFDWQGQKHIIQSTDNGGGGGYSAYLCFCVSINRLWTKLMTHTQQSDHSHFLSNIYQSFLVSYCLPPGIPRVTTYHSLISGRGHSLQNICMSYNVKPKNLQQMQCEAHSVPSLWF